MLARSRVILGSLAACLAAALIAPPALAEGPAKTGQDRYALEWVIGSAIEHKAEAAKADPRREAPTPGEIQDQVTDLVDEILEVGAMRAELMAAVASGDDDTVARVGGQYHKTFERLMSDLQKRGFDRDVVDFVEASINSSEEE